MSGPSRRAGTTSDEQPAEPIQAMLTVRLEAGGQLVTEWRAIGAAAELRRGLLRGLSGAAVELGDRHARALERGQIAGESHTVELLLLDGGAKGELLGEWKISGCGPKLCKRTEWAVSVVMIGLNAERVEIFRAVVGSPGGAVTAGKTRRKVGGYARDPQNQRRSRRAGTRQKGSPA